MTVDSTKFGWIACFILLPFKHVDCDENVRRPHGNCPSISMSIDHKALSLQYNASMIVYARPLCVKTHTFSHAATRHRAGRFLAAGFPSHQRGHPLSPP